MIPLESDSPVTVITGASRGIGKAIAARLMQKGHRVVNISRTTPRDLGVDTIEADLSNEGETQAALNEVTRRFEVDNLINNAALINAQSLEEVEFSKLDEVLQVNLRAAIQCAKAVLPSMKQKHRGRIVNISSRAVLGREDRTAYVATKAGLIGMARGWALELGQYGITVNCIAPGPIATEMLRAENAPDHFDNVAKDIPVRRIGEPEDIAAAAEYLISDDAGFVTGQTLYVCGGASIRHPAI